MDFSSIFVQILNIVLVFYLINILVLVYSMHFRNLWIYFLVLYSGLLSGLPQDHLNFELLSCYVKQCMTVLGDFLYIICTLVSDPQEVDGILVIFFNNSIFAKAFLTILFTIRSHVRSLVFIVPNGLVLTTVSNISLFSFSLVLN